MRENEHPYCENPYPGYPCSICGKDCCVNCDTYYYILNDKGEYITDANRILEIVGTLEDFVAHRACVDPALEVEE